MGVKGKKGHDTPRLSRRSFLKSIGVSSVSVAAVQGEGVVGQLEKAGILEKDVIVGPSSFSLSFMVNGKKVTTEVEPRTTLAEVLRNHLDLTGTKIGCNRGACGACTVIIDNKSVSSCMMLAIDAAGKNVQTIEGLESEHDKLHPLQENFIRQDALQCGFCTSGMIMSAKHLLDQNPSPSSDEIRTAVSGNLCRCGTYPHVFKAIEDTAKK